MSLDIFFSFLRKGEIRMIVTTAGRTDVKMTQYADQVANELGINFVNRKKRSINEMKSFANDDILIVGKNRIEIHPLCNEEPMFFHPNSAMFRIKRLKDGDHDPFIQACNLQNGNNILDCTLGLGSDSIVASYVVGLGGRVVGIEGDKYIAFLLKNGLCSWESGNNKMDEAMRRIEVIHLDCLEYLKSCPAKCFDVVYFDPMFEETISTSKGISGLRHFAVKSLMNPFIVNEAIRVAKKRVVMKNHWKSEEFERLGFSVYKRKTAKFHFGVIEIIN
jgi:hypothetical protein